MLDGYGRVIDYARISITDRCNLRCVYCMPETGIQKLSCDDVLSFEEIIRICGILAGLGIRKLKITGGEPLVRLGVSSLVSSLKAIPGIEQVSLTTNGVLLSKLAGELAAAGLDAVNVSLDTLDPVNYRALTRVGNLEDALFGIDNAISAGIKAVKINCVPIAGMNDGGAVELAALARDRDVHVRFIEVMPIGLGKSFPRVEGHKMRELLEEAYGEMTPFGENLGNGPARYYSLQGFQGKIGFINAVSGCFCAGCNRIRLTADGVLKTCLHTDIGVSLLDGLAHEDDNTLAEQITQAIMGKPAMHSFTSDSTLRSETRIMSQIGG